jgi:hypothetical protein
MDDDAVVERLDLILSVLHLAHHDAIERTRATLRSDPLSVAILDACGDDWTPARTVQSEVRSVVGAIGDSTVRRRLRELVARRALHERGATHTKAYRATGLV